MSQSVYHRAGHGTDSRTKRQRKIQRAVEAADKKGLSRLAIHMIERGTIAKMKGESSEHWSERQIHKQYDEQGRRRVEKVLQEIRDARLWPWH